LNNFSANYIEAAAIIVFGIGFATLLLQKNLIKKIIGLNIMDTAIFLFLAAKGYIFNRKAPIILNVNEIIHAEQYINPIPTGLVLTGIVVSVSVTAFMLALALKLYEYYGTLDTDKIILMAKGRDG